MKIVGSAQWNESSIAGRERSKIGDIEDVGRERRALTVGKVNWELWVMGCVLVMQEAKPWEPPQSTKLYPRNTTKRAA